MLQRRHTVVTSLAVTLSCEKLSYSIRIKKFYRFQRQQCPSCSDAAFGSSSLHEKSEADKDRVPNLGFPGLREEHRQMMMIFHQRNFNAKLLSLFGTCPPDFGCIVPIDWDCSDCWSATLAWFAMVTLWISASEAQARDVCMDLLQKELHPVYI